METRMNVLVIEKEPAVLKQLNGHLERFGFPFRCAGPPDLTMEQLEALVPDLAIIGPALRGDLRADCIQKLKILKPAMPILVCCEKGVMRSGPVELATAPLP